MPTVHLLIKGKVQGVFYRASAKKAAEALTVKGWIKNRPDGDVEAVITGNEAALQKFISWCWNGPSGATVTTVNETQLAEELFDSFQIVRS